MSPGDLTCSYHHPIKEPEKIPQVTNVRDHFLQGLYSREIRLSVKNVQIIGRTVITTYSQALSITLDFQASIDRTEAEGKRNLAAIATAQGHPTCLQQSEQYTPQNYSEPMILGAIDPNRRGTRK